MSGRSWVSGNIRVREMCFTPERKIVEGHAHNFDHTSYVPRGSALFEQLDDAGNVVRSVTKSASDGRNWVLILAGVCHRITALEDNTIVHCIYSHRDPDTNEVVQEWNGWELAAT